MQNKNFFWFGALLTLAVSYFLYLGFPYVTFTFLLSKYRYIEIIFIVIFVLSYGWILYKWIKRHTKSSVTEGILSEEKQNIEYEKYKKELLDLREQSIESFEKLSNDYQKALMTFAGGAIVLVVTFVASLIRAKESILFSEIILKSLFCLTTSLAAILLGMFLGLEARQHETEQIDKSIAYYDDEYLAYYGGGWNFWAGVTHITSFFSCILGIILLGFFIYFNVN